MQVFIEQPGEKNQKNVFDKETGEFLRTVTIELTYPYPYGYIPNTLAEDGDELDAYIITDKKLETSSIVECEPIGLVEWWEDGEADHAVLAVIKGENRTVDDEVKAKITHFANHFFDHLPEKKYKLGEFVDKQVAEEHIEECVERYQKLLK